ncbi:hypothetical protein NVP1259O_07 [Vibrio phage 1.259.O._10N.286.48.F4]|nr:hypothetical protein NVP1259O_07 [Vibrio phage 1.259.O._10N.286.48.F4]
MPSNILYSNDQMLEENNAIYGTNKVRYVPWINRVVSTETNHSNGSLGEVSVKEVGYDLTQKFPENKLAQVIKATSTELAQANANPRSFEYHKTVMGVEFVISNLKNANMSNVEAGILNELMKQYDVDGYNGSLGNQGIENNAMLVATSEMTVTDIDSLMLAIGAGRKALKANTDITDQDFSDVLVGYTDGISDILDLKSGDITGRKMVSDTFPLGEMAEMPKFISDGAQYLELYYKPMLKMHHGAAPSKYNTDAGSHGLSSKSLFVYESVGVEAESKGAIIRVPVKFS